MWPKSSARVGIYYVCESHIYIFPNYIGEIILDERDD